MNTTVSAQICPTANSNLDSSNVRNMEGDQYEIKRVLLVIQDYAMFKTSLWRVCTFLDNPSVDSIHTQVPTFQDEGFQDCIRKKNGHQIICNLVAMKATFLIHFSLPKKSFGGEDETFRM